MLKRMIAISKLQNGLINSTRPIKQSKSYSKVSDIIPSSLVKTANRFLHSENQTLNFISAVKYNDKPGIEENISLAQINREDKYGNTALHYAAANGNYILVKYLIDKGANPFLQNKNGATPFYEAAFNGRLDIVNYYLNEFSDARLSKWDILTRKTPSDRFLLTTKQGWSALIAAAENHQIKVVRALLTDTKIKDSINRTTKNNETALHRAVINNGFTESDNYSKKNINETLNYKRWLETVEYLINQGSRIDLNINEFISIINSNDFIENIYKNSSVPYAPKNSNTPLHISCQNGYTEVAKLLINKAKEMGDDYLLQYVNSQNSSWKRTPLQMAVTNGHLDLVKILLENKADINSVSIDGYDSLDLISAICNGKEKKSEKYSKYFEVKEEILGFYKKNNKPRNKLISYILNINKEDNKNLSIFNGFDSTKDLEQLIESDEKINKNYEVKNSLIDFISENHEKLIDKHDNSLLNAIIRPEYESLCLSVLEKIASNNNEDYIKIITCVARGKNLLHTASLFGLEKIVKKLITDFSFNKLPLKDRIEKKMVGGWAPITDACWAGHYNIVEILLTNGANANSCLPTGESCLYWAVDDKNIEMTNLLLKYNANINVCDNQGTSLLHLAVKNKDTVMVEELIKLGINTELKTKDLQLTPLHYAARNDDLTMIKLLVTHGAYNAISAVSGRSFFELLSNDNYRFEAKQLINQIKPELQEQLEQYYRLDKEHKLRHIIRDAISRHKIRASFISLIAISIFLLWIKFHINKQLETLTATNEKVVKKIKSEINKLIEDMNIDTTGLDTFINDSSKYQSYINSFKDFKIQIDQAIQELEDLNIKVAENHKLLSKTPFVSNFLNRPIDEVIEQYKVSFEPIKRLLDLFIETNDMFIKHKSREPEKVLEKSEKILKEIKYLKEKIGEIEFDNLSETLDKVDFLVKNQRGLTFRNINGCKKNKIPNSLLELVDENKKNKDGKDTLKRIDENIKSIINSIPYNGVFKRYLNLSKNETESYENFISELNNSLSDLKNDELNLNTLTISLDNYLMAAILSKNNPDILSNIAFLLNDCAQYSKGEGEIFFDKLAHCFHKTAHYKAPTSRAISNGLSYSYGKLGNHDKNHKEYYYKKSKSKIVIKEKIEDKPSISHLLNAGNTHYNLGEKSEARDCFLAATQVNPTYRNSNYLKWNAYYQLAILSYESHDYSSALSYLDKARETILTYNDPYTASKNKHLAMISNQRENIEKELNSAKPFKQQLYNYASYFFNFNATPSTPNTVTETEKSSYETKKKISS